MNNIFDNKFDILKNVFISGNIPHSLLFEVDNCDSFMSIIKSLAKYILCNEKNKSFDSLGCNKCSICNQIDQDLCSDFIVIETDSTWIKKQQLIDLKNEFNNKSINNNKRIYVIKEAEKLNTSSSNALLKFLEEPEDDIYAILLTTNRYELLDTIISRCQVYNFKNSINVDNAFKEKIDDFLKIILNKTNLFVNYKHLYEEVFIDKSNTILLLDNLEKYILLFFYDKSDNNILNNYNNDYSFYIKFIDIIENEKNKLDYNVNFKLWLDSFFSNLIGELYV